MPPADDIPRDQPVLIAGTTASGKSALALRIAEAGGGVIVNADAIQVYENWRVLTARPTAEEEARAPHRLYGHVPGGAEYSVGHWLREVAPLLAGGARPVIVGGTGLYLSALTEGLAEIPQTTPELRHQSGARLRAGGLEALIRDLDAETLARIDTRNPARVRRAWEVLKTTGRGLAEWQDQTPPPLLSLADCHAILVDAPRDWLAARIETRFRAMVEGGALDEARANLADWDPAAPSSKAIGAKELVSHLRGETDLETACAAAVAATRQFAKRQRTWLRGRMGNWHKVCALNL